MKHPNRASLIAFICLLLPFGGTVLHASADQFDFWLGEWDLTWVDREGKPRKGSNTVTRVLDGKTIHESFDGRPGISLVGESWSVWVEKEGKWKQTWVDNKGSYLDFTGGMISGQMILTREGFVQGKPALQRMRFFDIEKDSFDWVWEVSTNEGKRWQTIWLIHYKRADSMEENSTSESEG